MSQLHDAIHTFNHLSVFAKCFSDQSFDTVSSDSLAFDPFGYDQADTRIITAVRIYFYVQSQREAFEHDPVPQNSAKLVSFS